MRILSERLSEDGLQITKHVFWLSDDLILMLDSYWQGSRPTKRHNYKCSVNWQRLSHRNNTVNREDFTVLDELVADAVQKVKDAIKYKS